MIMKDQDASATLDTVQSRLNEIDARVLATRALFVDSGFGICIKVPEEIWNDRALMEKISRTISAVEDVSAVYLEI